uniref:Uncharacterized protein n=1 Tax=Rhizophora mucronata TaxID=61149 RepID=A0A2P2QCK6_RHIMU
MFTEAKGQKRDTRSGSRYWPDCGIE